MPCVEVVIEAAVGGAPLNERFAQAIGADADCRDAAVVVEAAKALIAREA